MFSFAETFFPAGLHSQLPPHHRMSNSVGYCVLGASQSGKSSFAFQSVMNVLQGNGGALLICHESAQSSSDICSITPMTSLSTSQADRLEISFVQTHSECRGLLSSIGTSLDTSPHSEGPSIILVEADCFSDAYDTYEIGKTLATLDSTISYLRSVHQHRITEDERRIVPLFVFVLPISVVPPHITLKGGLGYFGVFPFSCSPSTSMITLVLDSSSRNVLVSVVSAPLEGIDGPRQVLAEGAALPFHMSFDLKMTRNGFQIA